MISAITDINDLSGGKASPLYARAVSAFKTRFLPFDGVYKQTDSSGNVTALFSCADSHCTFIYSVNPAKDELNSFFKFGKISSVTSCEKNDIPESTDCGVFKLLKFCEKPSNGDAEMLKSSDGISLYRALFNGFGDYLGFDDFSLFYLALAPKITNGDAALFYVAENGEPVSFAAAPNICECSALISGVFTKRNFINKGYASRCVSALVFEMAKRNVGNIFLWCDTATVGFYKRLGFKEVSNIFIGGLK